MIFKRMLVIMILMLIVMVGVAQGVIAQGPSPIATPVVQPLPTTEVNENGPAPAINLPTEVPATATGGLVKVGALFGSITAWLIYQFMKFVSFSPAATDKDKGRWKSLGNSAITVLMAFITDYVLTYLGMLAGWLDSNGFWTVFLWGLSNIPLSWGMYQGGKITGALIAAKR